MKNLNFYIAFMVLNLSFIYTYYSQENNTYISPVPNLAPVSPESASFGKYGSIPVNLATGKFTLTIPIFTIKESNYQLPIHINYSYDGLMVEEDPGILGPGWSLIAGGKIIRQMFGRPDNKHDRSRSGNLYSYIAKFHFNPSLLNENIKYGLAKASYLNTMDTEPDRFVLVGLGLNGTFSYNEHGKAIIYPYKQYIINQSTNGNKFNISDDYGNEFIFSDIEFTTVESWSGGGPIFYTSSWNITKIIPANSGHSINFFYYTNLPTYEKRTENIQENKILNTNNSLCNEVGLPFISYSGNDTEIHDKIIKIIEFSEGKILFDIKVDRLAENHKRLHQIKIFDKFGKLREKYEFIYLDSSFKTKWNLLKEIKKYGYSYNQNGSIVEKSEPFYRFEYYGTIPSKLNINSRDAWGYYNGKTYNSITSLLLDERSINFDKTRLGALKKIYYPTGGWSQFEYEQNTANEIPPSYLYGGVCTTNPLNQQITISAEGTRPVATIKKDSIFIPVDQIIKVQLIAKAESNGTATASISATSRLECDKEANCNDYCSLSVTAQGDEMGTYENNVSSNSYNQINYFEVPGGTTIYLKVEADLYDYQGEPTFAQVKIDYWDGLKKDIKIGGIRIKNIISFNGKDIVKRTFNYKDEKNLHSSGNLLSHPVYKWKSDFVYLGANKEQCKATYEHKALKSRVPIFRINGSPVLYERIEEIFNDGKNGKIVHYFTLGDKLDIPTLPFLSKNPKNWKRALLKKKIYYDKFSTKIEETLYDYKVFYPFEKNMSNEMHSVAFRATKKTTGNAPDGSIYYYHYDTYSDFPEFYHLIKTTKKKYFNNKSLTIITNYLYDKYTGNLKEEYTSDSKGNLKITKYYYAYDVSNNKIGNIATRLSSQEIAAYKLMQSPHNNPNGKNMLAIPIQIEKYKNNNLFYSKRKVFEKFGNINQTNTPLLGLKKVLITKETSGLEETFTYHQYDSYGNPLLVSKKDGVPIYYIWGYDHSKLIGEITNFTSRNNKTIMNLIQRAIALSNVDSDNMVNNPTGKEYQLWKALNQIRQSLPQDSRMTFYTYDPIIGVTSITDEKGEVSYYYYDAFSRLKYIKDSKGHILKEYDYHYQEN